MSISVTVSGDESTSVISSQLNTGSISVSGSESIQVTSAGVNSASVTISTGDPVTITGNFSNFVTGSVVRPDDISSFITSSNLSALEAATGDLNTRVNSNDSDITSLNSATGVLNTATGALSTATGLLVPKSETGSFLTSGQIDTNISTAVSNLVDSAPSTLDTLNELASGLGNNPNFATTITATLGNKVNKSETGSFAVTGSDVTFSNLTVAGDILPENNVVSDIGSPSKRFKDLYLSGNSIFLGDSRLSFTPGATGGLNITGQGTTGRFIQDVETGSLLSPFETSTGLLNTATGTLSTATGELNTATGSLSVATGALNTATGSLSSATGSLNTATGTLNTNIGTVSGLITSNDSDIADLNTATGLLTGATGALNTATGALNTATGVLNTATGTLSIATGVLNTATGVLNTATGVLNTATGTLSTATGALSTATGVLQGVTGSFAQTGSGNFGVLNVTGNLGIGTTSPSDELTIRGAQFNKTHISIGDNTDRLRLGYIHGSSLESSTSAAQIGSSASRELKIAAASTNSSSIKFYTNTGNGSPIQRMVIDDTGNIGIGTNTPQAKLHVNGDTLLSGNLTTSGTIQITSDGSSSSDNSPFSFEVSADRKNTATTALYIYPTDTTNHRVFFQNPAQNRNMFAVSFAGATQIEDTPAFNNLTAKSTTTNGDNFGLGTVAGVGVRRNATTDNFDLFVSHNSNVPDFVFHAKTGGFFTTNAQLTGGAHEIMRLTNEGNLGIGTNSPDSQLHIKSIGDVLLKLEADTDNTNENDNPIIQFVQDNGLISANVGFNGNTNTDFTGAIDNAFYIENTSSAAGFGAIQFASNNQAQLTILSGGNVGIGTNSPQAKLHVSGDTIVSGGNLQIGSTPAYSQTRSIKLHDNGVQFGARVSLIGTNDNGGPGLEMVTDGNLSKRTLIRHEGEGSNDYGLSFFTTNGGVVSEKVRFDGNGGVGIGTSSVTAGKLLDVDGDVKFINVSASEIDAAGGDGYFIENKQFAKLDTALLFGDHDGEGFATDIFGNGGIPMIRITGDGSQVANTFVGIRNTSPTEALDVSGNILSNGVIKAFNNTQNVAQLEVGRDNNQFLEMKVSDPDCFITANQDSDSNGDHHFVLDRVFAGTGANDFEIRKSGTAQVTVDTNGNVGIGTGSPSAKLHVIGSGIVTNDFAVDTNTLFVDASANGVGIRTSTPRNLYALHVDDNFLVTNGAEDHFDIDTTTYVYKLGDISGGDNGSFFEINSPNGVASLSQAFFGIGVTLPQAALHVNGTATVSGGLTTLGKTTLSSDAFVIETGSFTLGNTHKGATVLLQNSASINITIPSQVSGYVTTFIAETHNPVSFITGSGMSGLNSFNGASDIAGIYGQAQVIYKSPEYAFLGGNIV